MKQVLLIFTTLAVLNFCSQLEAQKIIITKQGQLFQCDIGEISDHSIPYSFLFNGQIYRDTISKEMVAYHGENFIRNDSANIVNEYQNDLIITKDGDLMTCKITNYVASSSIEYAFLVENREGKNIISKKEVAFYRKSFRQKVDIVQESSDYYNSLGFISELTKSLPEPGRNTNWQDSIQASKDLIVTIKSDEFVCSVDEIGTNNIYYSFFLNNMVMENTVNKKEVYYLVKDYKGESPERIIITPGVGEYTDIVITETGTVIYCFINNVGPNTIEYYIPKEGFADYQIIEKRKVLYHGHDFLDALEGHVELEKSIYNDFIVTRNKSVLLCNIESESLSSVKYSFQMNKMTMMNIIQKDDLIYYGRNFRKLHTENQVLETGNSKEKVPVAQFEPLPGKVETIDATKQYPAENEKDFQAPEVVIVSPALTGETSFEAVPDEVNSIRITGVVKDISQISRLTVNYQNAVLDEQGKFSSDIELNSGTNPINITAADIHNNTRSISYTIERNIPVKTVNAVVSRDTEPPVIQIDNPEMDPHVKLASVSNTQKSAIVSGNVTDLSGVYEVLINGRDAVISADGKFSGEVLLRVGENNITVRATDLESNYVAQSFVIIREDTDIQANQPEILGGSDKYYALIIGISEYQDPMIPDLDEHPSNDAKMLSKILMDKYLFEEENMYLLLNPKRVEILKSFDFLSKTITEVDNLLIFFAGHGYYDPETNLGYWLPADAESEFTADWIYNDVLVANLKRIHSRHTLLISDACFSGSIFKSRSLTAAPVAYQKKYELRSRKAITSGVVENVPNESIFFKYLMSVLATNQSRFMSAGELYRSLEFPVSNNSPNSPQYGTIQNVDDQGGDFIFIKK